MKILFIGGTGTISEAITKLLLSKGEEVWLLNRGSRNADLEGAKHICCDIGDEEKAAELLNGMSFDCVADFIGFVPEQVMRDFRLFSGKTKQYIFISSASAYQKPLGSYIISEGTPLANPFWEYSRNKIACEDLLMKMYRENGFPVTIVRPSHTYCDRSVPVGVHGRGGSGQVVKRMLEGKPVIVHGDGSSLWTMTHCDDFAAAFAGLIGNIHAIGEAVQITSDETLTWNQIYTALAGALGVEYKPYYVPSDFLAKCSSYDFEGGLIGDKANSVVFDNAKLKRLVPGFNAQIRFDQGVKRAVEYVLSHKECQQSDAEFDHWCDKVIEAMEDAVKSVLS